MSTKITTQRDYHAALVKLNDYVAEGLSTMTEDESQVQPSFLSFLFLPFQMK